MFSHLVAILLSRKRGVPVGFLWDGTTFKLCPLVLSFHMEVEITMNHLSMMYDYLLNMTENHRPVFTNWSQISSYCSERFSAEA